MCSECHPRAVPPASVHCRHTSNIAPYRTQPFRAVLDWKLTPTCQPGETMTDMPYGLHAKGIRKALDYFRPLGIPFYLTELGVADRGDAVRRRMIETYMPEVGGLNCCALRRGSLLGSPSIRAGLRATRRASTDIHLSKSLRWRQRCGTATTFEACSTGRSRTTLSGKRAST